VTQTIEMIWVDPSSRNSVIEPKTLFAMSVLLKRKKLSSGELFYLAQKWWSQQESNLQQSFRKASLHPIISKYGFRWKKSIFSRATNLNLGVWNRLLQRMYGESHQNISIVVS
jgi:hypothetical protein